VGVSNRSRKRLFLCKPIASGDLIREINGIQELKTFDCVIFEPTGIAEPQAVAKGFCYEPVTAQLMTDDADKML
jgi:G3E family GTPase